MLHARDLSALPPSPALMDFDEVVVHEVQRNRVRVHLDLLGKRIRQAREAAIVHPHRQVLTLDVGCGDVRSIRHEQVKVLIRDVPPLRMLTILEVVVIKPSNINILQCCTTLPCRGSIVLRLARSQRSEAGRNPINAPGLTPGGVRVFSAQFRADLSCWPGGNTPGVAVEIACRNPSGR